MKKSITLLTSAVLSFAVVSSVFADDTTVSMTVGSPVMTVNGEELNIDENGTSPVIVNERTLLPVRAVVEAFDGVVDFEAEDKTVRLEYNGTVIKMQINGNYAEVNGARKELDVSPTIINGRTMLPIRFIADNFGFTIKWDAKTKTATVTNGEISEDDTIVATTVGKIQGKNENGVYSFLGIPYAQANEKFVNASPIESWDGVRQATEYSDMSPQFAILGIGENNAGEGTSNNCQNLNIWTTDTNGKKPVMVWLHGGGFSTGSANEVGYDGTNLSKTGDVVVVGVNHRLNVFGHLDLTAYGEKYANSDNVGMTDIIVALQWVRENIDQFGGDPNNVTIFGESGGGAKVLAMMTSPDAKGLFHKAIVESGATENMGVSFLDKDLSLELGDLVVEKLGLTKETIDEIQNIDNVEIMNAAAEAQQELANKYKIPISVGEGYSLEWEPVVDGDLLPTDPVLENGFAEAGKDIPLLIGSNLNEWTMFMPATAHPGMTDEQREMYAQAYPNEDPETAPYVDTLIRKPMLKIMSHKADQNGADVYAYIFTKQIGDMGSYHGAELLYVFGTENADKELAQNVMQAWANFAKTGVPSADDLPEWKPYDRENMATMILDDESELVYGNDKKLFASLEPDYKY